MTKARHTIWSNRDLDISDWRDDLKEEHPDYDDDELIEEMYRLNNEYLDDERINLSKELPHPIIVFGDLGLWNGRTSAVKKINSCKISDCLYTECDYAEWYVDENGDLQFKGVHHDGTNYYTYKMLNCDDNWDEVYNEFIERIFEKKPVEDLIKKYTEPIGPYIAEIYGWE